MSWFDQNRPIDNSQIMQTPAPPGGAQRGGFSYNPYNPYPEDPYQATDQGPYGPDPRLGDPTYTTGMGIDERTGQPRAPVGGPDPRLQIPSGEPGSPGNTGGAPPPTGAGGAAPTLNRNDPASVQAFISYYAQQPGANPSLARDPGYWAGKISSGELGSDQNYIIGKFMTPEGAPAGSYNNGLNGPVGATPFNFQYDPNSPDAQFIRGEAMRAATQGFAARGTLNTGGAVKALQDRAAGLASVDLGNQFQRQLTTHQTNFNEPLQANNQAFGQNFNLANLGLNATTAGINGANAVATNATSYANTAQNNTNAQGGYQTNIGNAQANGTLGSQNAYNNFYGDLGNLSRQYPNY